MLLEHGIMVHSLNWRAASLARLNQPCFSRRFFQAITSLR